MLWVYPLALALTLAMEGFVFIALNYRDKTFLKLFVAVNVASNLSLNLILFFYGYLDPPILDLSIRHVWINERMILTVLLEVLVVFAEYWAFKALLGRSKKLFWVVVLANAFSGIIGSLLLSNILLYA